MASKNSNLWNWTIVQEEELKGAAVLIFANKQVKTIFFIIHNLDKFW